MSDSLPPHESQHTRPPCLSSTPGVYSDSRSSIQWCHPAISSSVFSFSSCSQSLPASESFPASHSSHVLSKVLDFHFSIIPSKEIPGLIFRMAWLDLLALQGTLKSLLQHHSSKASILRWSTFFTVQLPHPYMATGKAIAMTRPTFVGKIMSLLFNMVSRLVITFYFFPQGVSIFEFHGCSHHLQWFWSPPKIKSDTVSTAFPSFSHEVMGPDAKIFVFWMWSFKPTFSLFSFAFIKTLFHSSSLSARRVVSSAFLRLLIFLSAVLFPACASFSPTFLMMYPA